jgi:hypothetical protein
MDMGPGFNRGSGGGSHGCGFEERAGAHARTEGVISFSRRCLCVCVWRLKRQLRSVAIKLYINGSWPFKTPQHQGRELCYARRRALPVCGSDNPRRTKLYTRQALKMGRSVRRDKLRGTAMSEVSRDAVRGFGL